MKKKRIYVAVLLLIAIGMTVFTANNYSLYDDTIGVITNIEETQLESKFNYDGNKSIEEEYYKQDITIKIKNGDHKGETLYAENTYAKSAVYDDVYSKGDKVFIEQISNDGKLTGKLAGVKRDYYVVLTFSILFVLFLVSAGKDGALTLVSLGINLVVFYVILRLYLNGLNILIMTIPMVIFFTALLLFFMYGFKEKSVVSFVAIVLSVGVTGIIGYIALQFSHNVDYSFMEYMPMPFENQDGERIFVSELIIGCLGAITDVVVTIVITLDQITKHNPDVERKTLTDSCRAVGDDVTGTMVGIMLFSNLASSIPFTILSMRNGIALITVLKYNSFFQIARFLTGSIGIVISIPIAGAVFIAYYNRKRRREKC